ncbi:hypothetical protein NTE_02497 [Candidatus Nitrososphaera evergladensis SR1]|uniref:Uncharacterized protein n=1 Tax=Candidatus Nitrososphaera evergladensis SR1 TaxID=1459636 RepID=A0A075MSJ1_9ARCH|nr:hypothetical protein [Candidatus Nitrososphaera evergladensis]AIF84546.1 hypothetical protein NTE_02497 [Candidatus Nitrososphaera evergladensis SR1]
MSTANSAEFLTTTTVEDDFSYDRRKLTELGVNTEFLKFMNDEQARELLKSLLYLIVKKQDGYA